MASINNSTLYPPIMDTYQNAVVKEDVINKEKGIKVNFTISNYTNIADIKEIQVIIKTQDGVNSILKNEIYFYSNFSITPLSNSNIIIEIPNAEIIKEKLKIDEYYRVQIRFSKVAYSSSGATSIENFLSKWVDYFSEWSSVSLIKIIPASSISIEQFNFGNRGRMSYISSLDDISGSLVFTEKTSEYLLNYRIKVFENPNNDSIEELIENTEPIEDSGLLNANVYKKDYFYYLFKYDFSKGITYNFIIEYETNNSFKDNLFFSFRIIESKVEPLIAKSIDNSKVFYNSSKSCNSINIKFKTGYTGKIIIRRTDSKSNYKKFEDIYVGNLFQEDNSSWLWSDYTVESGVMYKYAIQEKDIYNNRSQKYYLNNNPVLVELNDIFLIDKDNILKIEFDPSISGYRRVTKDSLIETIGSQYPFMTRGAATNYKTFELNGTISWDSDVFEEKIESNSSYMIHSDDEDIREDIDIDFNRHLFANLTKIFSFEEIAREYREIKNNYNRHKDYVIEKLFREMVLDYLVNGKPKLYKSLTEGNMIVKLTNVTLEPKNELGRFIFSFSCTATEIDDNTIDNYKFYNIIYYKEEQEDFTTIKKIAGQIETPSFANDYDLLDLIKNKYEYIQNGSQYTLQNLTKIIITPKNFDNYTTFKIELNGKEIVCFGTFELRDTNIESLILKQELNHPFVIQYIGDYIRTPYYVDTEVNGVDSVVGEEVISINPNTSLVQLLKKKYNYDGNNSKNTFLSLNRAYISVLNKDQYNQLILQEGDVHFVFEVKDFDIESQENDLGHNHKTIYINDDESLELFDKNYLINDLIYKGIDGSIVKYSTVPPYRRPFWNYVNDFDPTQRQLYPSNWSASLGWTFDSDWTPAQDWVQPEGWYAPSYWNNPQGWTPAPQGVSIYDFVPPLEWTPIEEYNYLKFKNYYYDDVIAQYQNEAEGNLLIYYPDFTIFKAKDFKIQEGYANYDEEDYSLYHEDSNSDNNNYDREEWYFAHAVEKDYISLGGKLYEYDAEEGIIYAPADIIFDYVCEIERSQTRNV